MDRIARLPPTQVNIGFDRAKVLLSEHLPPHHRRARARRFHRVATRRDSATKSLFLRVFLAFFLLTFLHSAVRRPLRSRTRDRNGVPICPLPTRSSLLIVSRSEKEFS